VTDDPLPSPPASIPSGRRHRASDSRPDLRLRLLEAVQQRDASQVRVLAQRWVHRRGLVSLEAFQRITLRSLDGEEGCRWLQEQLGLEPPPALGDALAAALGPELRLHDQIMARVGRSVAAAPVEVPATSQPLPSVERAFAALAAEFPGSEYSGNEYPGNDFFALDEPAALQPSAAEPAPLEPALVEPAPVEPSAVEPAGDEPLAPLPCFHPTASILAALADPVPQAASASGVPRWLPRLRFPAPARRPAPPPADLADLRAWLPDADADADLPRAC
jgi:hypothetical protein